MNPYTTPGESYYAALQAYIASRKQGDNWPILPQRNDSSINCSYVYLRRGKYLLAIFSISNRCLVPLTPELISNHSKPS